MTWKDVTSYSRADKEPRVPRTFERQIGPFRLVVTRHIHLPPMSWLIHCNGMFERVLVDQPAEAAQKACEAEFKKIIAATMQQLEKTT